MWFAHFTLPLIIFLYFQDFSLVGLIYGSLIPYFDLIPIIFKLKDRTFHEGVIHTPFAILLFSFPFLFVSITLFTSSIISGLLHIVCDAGSNHGIMLFYPFSKWFFAFNLWKDTGLCSKEFNGIFHDFRSYFSQKFPLFIEMILIVLTLFLCFTQL